MCKWLGLLSQILDTFHHVIPDKRKPNLKIVFQMLFYDRLKKDGGGGVCSFNAFLSVVHLRSREIRENQRIIIIILDVSIEQ